jgi:putative ABC transport system substrate-binding protein
LAADLEDRKVEVIVASGGLPSALAAQNATSTIQIVFIVGDPVASGLVASLARPGGNLTGVGVLMTELMPKRLELISEFVPQTRMIGLLVNPNDASTERLMRDMQEAARAKGVQLPVLKAGGESEFESAFASLVQLHAGALVVSADPFFLSQREQLVALASHHAIPAIYEWRESVTAGGLISYGPSLASVSRQAGIHAGKILNGAKPADLPVEQPTRFELVVNLKTAKALGLTVPPRTGHRGHRMRGWMGATGAHSRLPGGAMDTAGTNQHAQPTPSILAPMKPYRGPPRTLVSAPLHGSGLSYGARRASIRSSRTRQRWLLGTAPTPASSIGARGCLFPLRRTAGRYGRDRNQATIRLAALIHDAPKCGSEKS